MTDQDNLPFAINDDDVDIPAPPKPVWQRLRRLPITLYIGGALVSTFVFVALLSFVWTPYPPNQLNIPDTVQRLHWEPERARELGLPTSYDYGGLRETWLCHLVTDWMGDDAWLWKFECQHRRFNFIGDTTWLTGEVADKRQVETPHGIQSEVDLVIRCTNQRGVVTSPGKATVLLPSREHGDVRLPKPAVNSLDGMLEYEIDRLKPE